MIINVLKVEKSAGSHNISNFLSKLTRNILTLYLTYFINRSFSESVFPEKLKIAVVTPIHKRGRPIWLLSTISKFFEQIIHLGVYNFLGKCSLTYPKQFGLRNRLSTMDALMNVIEDIRLNFNRKTKCVGFFLDHKNLKTWKLWNQRHCSWLVCK